MKKIRLLFIYICLTVSLQAQKVDLKGTVVDTLDEPLIGATVMLLSAKDSVLTKFGITNNRGQFALEQLSPDDYILQITYLGYANFSQPISLANQLEDKDLAVIQLLPENALLETVEIKAEHIPIQIKNDTIEYNAAAFQTRPNAAVEDLLKKLPGVEVQRDGTIKAQGETVQNVLVDGKEFFGNNPQIATKNLPADAVDKVQVFDKKSDIAEFSGIDDGQEAKTINLSLKEDKKKGYFGRATGGFGTEERYEGKFNVNRFGKNTQYSAIGMLNNTNQQGFSFNDYISMMGGLNNLLSAGDGGVSLNLDSDELGLPLDDGRNNHGFNRTGAGGINLNKTFNKRTKLHLSYFYNNQKRDYQKIANRRSLLANESYHSERKPTTIRRNKGHKLNANFESKIDSFQTIKWRTSIGYNDRKGSNQSFSETFNLSNILQNEGTRNYESTGDNFVFNTNLIYLRRFTKKGRLLTGNLAFENRNGMQKGELESLNHFFGQEIFSDSLKQNYFQDNDQINYGLKVSYTEPIGKRKYLEINYFYQNYNNNLKKEVFDIKDRILFTNEQLSNHFQRDYLYNKAGLNFKMNQKKWKLSTGINAQYSTLKGDFILEALVIKKQFFNVLPTLRLNYDFKATRSLRFNYRTNIREPSLEQLQPIVDNSDPLNIYVGNPDLVPEYAHTFDLSFNSFDQFSGLTIFANFNAAITENSILNARTIDELFKQTIQPINYGKDKRATSYLTLGAPIKFLKSRLRITSDLNFQKGNYLVNDQADTFNALTSGLDFAINNKNTEIVDLAIGAKFNRNRIKYAIDEGLNQIYSDQIYYTDLSVNIGEKWTVSTTMDYTKYSKTSFSEGFDLPIWQAAIAHHFLKNKKGTLKLAAFDILNKNQGINRFNQLNFVQEERTASLGRYFLLSFSYALSGFGGENDSGITVERRR